MQGQAAPQSFSYLIIHHGGSCTWIAVGSCETRQHGDKRIAQLFDQGFDSRRQFKNGIGEWLVAHGFIYESSTVVASTSGVSGGDQGATKIPIVLKNGECERLGQVVGLKAIANKQAGLDIVELVVIFSPVDRAVQPVAAMAFKISNACELEFFEIIRLVQRVLEIGVAAYRVERSVFVDFCSL